MVFQLCLPKSDGYIFKKLLFQNRKFKLLCSEVVF